MSIDHAITQAQNPADPCRPFRVIRLTDGYMSPKGYPVGGYRTVEENLTAQEAVALLARLQGGFQKEGV